MSEISFVSTGNEEGDRLVAEGHDRTETHLDAGLCPNGCGQLAWPGPFQGECAKCGFGWSPSRPYGKRETGAVN